MQLSTLSWGPQWGSKESYLSWEGLILVSCSHKGKRLCWCLESSSLVLPEEKLGLGEEKELVRGKPQQNRTEAGGPGHGGLLSFAASASSCFCLGGCRPEGILLLTAVCKVGRGQEGPGTQVCTEAIPFCNSFRMSRASIRRVNIFSS